MILQRFTKKPITIEAVRWDGTYEQALSIRSLLGDSLECGKLESYPPIPFLRIPTLEGVMGAAPGDYIIKGVGGEIYHCKPAIFEASYESPQAIPAQYAGFAPHQLRVVREAAELEDRLVKLNKFRAGNPMWPTLEPGEQSRLSDQAPIMGCYLGVLRRRITVMLGGKDVFLEPPPPRAAIVSNAPEAFSLLLESYKILRAGWRTKFRLGLGTTQYPAADPPILRIPDDGSPPMPWTPTEDDLFANDYLNSSGQELGGRLGENDVSAISIEEGGFPWALATIQAGGTVLIGNGPLKLSLGYYTLPLTVGYVTLEPVEPVERPCIKLTLPNGQTRIWRPQHQDLWGSYSPCEP